MDSILTLLKAIDAAIWGVPLLMLLIGVSIFLSFLLRGIQFRYLFRSFTFIKSDKQKESNVAGDISPFQALMTAMASAVGTGSIVGVSTAIMTGGLGAVFWIWVMTFLGMAIKYAESLLAVKYRGLDKRGEMSGGPMYYIERGLGLKWLAVLFALFAIIATIGTGNLIQINSIASAVSDVFQVSPLYSGIVLMLVTALVLFRGIKGIGFASSVLVPVMGAFYIIAGFVICCIFYKEIPGILSLIFTSAFSGHAAVGGFVGATVMQAIQMGISRSILSSEAGLGVSSIAAAAARTTSSGRQALLSMSATLLSTAIICTITALVIGVSGLMGTADSSGMLLNGASLAIKAFNSTIWGGQYIVAFGLILFAYTTVIAWAYYGEKCCEYIFGESSVVIYRIIYTVLIIPGALFALDTVWTFANIMNALMIIPNMIAILGLSGVIQKETADFLIEDKKTREATTAPATLNSVVPGEV